MVGGGGVQGQALCLVGLVKVIGWVAQSGFLGGWLDQACWLPGWARQVCQVGKLADGLV